MVALILDPSDPWVAGIISILNNPWIIGIITSIIGGYMLFLITMPSRHLISPYVKISQDITDEHDIVRGRFDFPTVGFTILNRDTRPLNLLVELRFVLDGEDKGTHENPKYSGKMIWRLESLSGLRNGNFGSMIPEVREGQRLEIEVKVTYTNKNERLLGLPPSLHPLFLKRAYTHWVYWREKDYWYSEPFKVKRSTPKQ